MINGVYGSETRSSGGNLSSHPQVSALIPRPTVVGNICKQNRLSLLTQLNKLINNLLHTYLVYQWHYCLDNFAKTTGLIIRDYFYMGLIIKPSLDFS